MRLNNKNHFICVPLIFILFACSEPKLPQDVAADFWKGIQAKDIRLLYDSVSTQTVEEIKLDDLPQIKEIYLGETTSDESEARVVTVVEMIMDNEEMSTRDVNLTTLLLNENGKWKVDYDTTVSALTVSTGYVEFLDEVEKISDAFQEKFNTVIDEYQNAIPEVQREFEKLEEHLQQRLPEMQRKMEEFAKDLEEAMKPPADPPEAPIEI